MCQVLLNYVMGNVKNKSKNISSPTRGSSSMLLQYCDVRLAKIDINKILCSISARDTFIATLKTSTSKRETSMSGNPYGNQNNMIK